MRFTMLFAALALGSCSLRGLATKGLAESFAGAAEVFASEDDPELAREALPFALKAIEAALASDPENEGLLLAAAAGFAQYAAGFVAADAERAEGQDFARASALRERALRLELRARDYGLRALEGRHPGLTAALPRDPGRAVQVLVREDVPLAYWTGAGWGLALGNGIDRPEIAADVDVVRALLRRCLELDESYSQGALHEVMIQVEALPEAMGGSQARAHEHFARAVELSGGRHAGPYVGLASVEVGQQDRPAFERLLAQALAIDPHADPAAVLANRLAQDRARHLLEIADELFLPPLE